MTKANYFVSSLCLSLVLQIAIPSARALADDDSRKKHSRPRLVAAAHRGAAEGEMPLGVVESVGSFRVNGRSAFGKGMIWRDDLLQAPAGLPARVSLGAFGRATLERGAVVRFTTVESIGHRDLVVRLIAGSVAVALQPETRAFLSASDGAFIAEAGSKFRFVIRENRSVVDLVSGKAAELGEWQIEAPPPILLAAARFTRLKAAAAPQSYRIRPVGGVVRGAVFDARARTRREVQVQVTDENDRPVPDIPIIFALGSKLGTFSSTTAATNAQGIATVSFTPGAQAGSAPFTATIQGTNIQLSGQIVIAKPIPSFWSFQNAGPVLATAAAAVAVTTVAATANEDSLKIQAVGRPVIRP
jgi:hypothetical protein